MGRILNEYKEKYFKNYSTRNMIVYLTLRFLVILTLIRQIVHGNWNNVFLCVLTLILFLAPDFINKKLNIKLPDLLQIMILLFIFAAEILGEINEFYIAIPHWDLILHTINGFLCAAIGFASIDILNQKDFFHKIMSPWFVAVVAFSFSMTVGILWEFFEFGVDKILLKDMQKDTIINTISSVELDPEKKNNSIVIENIKKTVIYSVDKNGNEVETIIDGGYMDIGINDTIEDLLVNFIGAVVFSCLGMLYVKNRDKYKFTENFIPKLKTNVTKS